MKCMEAEERMSEYMEGGLPPAGMERMRRHLAQCPRCAALLDAVRLAVDACRNCPEPEMDPRLPGRILARTAGCPAPVPFRVRLKRFFLEPLLAPRFAVGAGLTALFFALTVHFMLPRVPDALARVSPSQIYTFMDRGVRRLYGEGLRAYDKKNRWQAEFSYLKESMIHRLQYVMEKFDASAGGSGAPAETEMRKETGERSSGLRRMPA